MDVHEAVKSPENWAQWKKENLAMPREEFLCGLKRKCYCTPRNLMTVRPLQNTPTKLARAITMILVSARKAPRNALMLT